MSDRSGGSTPTQDEKLTAADGGDGSMKCPSQKQIIVLTMDAEDGNDNNLHFLHPSYGGFPFTHSGQSYYTLEQYLLEKLLMQFKLEDVNVPVVSAEDISCGRIALYNALNSGKISRAEYYSFFKEHCFDSACEIVRKRLKKFAEYRDALLRTGLAYLVYCGSLDKVQSVGMFEPELRAYLENEGNDGEHLRVWAEYPNIAPDEMGSNLVGLLLMKAREQLCKTIPSDRLVSEYGFPAGSKNDDDDDVSANEESDADADVGDELILQTPSPVISPSNTPAPAASQEDDADTKDDDGEHGSDDDGKSDADADSDDEVNANAKDADNDNDFIYSSPIENEDEEKDVESSGCATPVEEEQPTELKEIHDFWDQPIVHEKVRPTVEAYTSRNAEYLNGIQSCYGKELPLDPATLNCIYLNGVFYPSVMHYVCTTLMTASMKACGCSPKTYQEWKNKLLNASTPKSLQRHYRECLKYLVQRGSFHESMIKEDMTNLLKNGLQALLDQNEDVLTAVARTSDHILVYCDPNDQMAGVGTPWLDLKAFIKENHSTAANLLAWMNDPQIAPLMFGKNLVGQVLMQLRADFADQLPLVADTITLTARRKRSYRNQKYGDSIVDGQKTYRNQNGGFVADEEAAEDPEEAAENLRKVRDKFACKRDETLEYARWFLSGLDLDGNGVYNFYKAGIAGEFHVAKYELDGETYSTLMQYHWTLLMKEFKLWSTDYESKSQSDPQEFYKAANKVLQAALKSSYIKKNKFNDWLEGLFPIMLRSVRAKFNQNLELQPELLQETGDKFIAFTNCYNKGCGIGLKKEQLEQEIEEQCWTESELLTFALYPDQRPKECPGRNFLGLALMVVRQEIKVALDPSLLPPMNAMDYTLAYTAPLQCPVEEEQWSKTEAPVCLEPVSVSSAAAGISVDKKKRTIMIRKKVAAPPVELEPKCEPENAILSPVNHISADEGIFNAETNSTNVHLNEIGNEEEELMLPQVEATSPDKEFVVAAHAATTSNGNGDHSIQPVVAETLPSSGDKFSAGMSVDKSMRKITIKRKSTMEYENSTMENGLSLSPTKRHRRSAGGVLLDFQSPTTVPVRTLSVDEEAPPAMEEDPSKKEGPPVAQEDPSKKLVYIDTNMLPEEEDDIFQVTDEVGPDEEAGQPEVRTEINIKEAVERMLDDSSGSGSSGRSTPERKNDDSQRQSDDDMTAKSTHAKGSSDDDAEKPGRARTASKSEKGEEEEEKPAEDDESRNANDDTTTEKSPSKNESALDRLKSLELKNTGEKKANVFAIHAKRRQEKAAAEAEKKAKKDAARKKKKRPVVEKKEEEGGESLRTLLGDIDPDEIQPEHFDAKWSQPQMRAAIEHMLEQRRQVYDQLMSNKQAAREKEVDLNEYKRKLVQAQQASRARAMVHDQ